MTNRPILAGATSLLVVALGAAAFILVARGDAPYPVATCGVALEVGPATIGPVVVASGADGAYVLKFPVSIAHAAAYATTISATHRDSGLALGFEFVTNEGRYVHGPVTLGPVSAPNGVVPGEHFFPGAGLAEVLGGYEVTVGQNGRTWTGWLDLCPLS